jgi:hypothetical protein
LNDRAETLFTRAPFCSDTLIGDVAEIYPYGTSFLARIGARGGSTGQSVAMRLYLFSLGWHGEVTGSSPVSDHQPGCFAVIAAASELNRLF